MQNIVSTHEEIRVDAERRRSVDGSSLTTELGIDSYLRYMSEAETYNFVTSEKRGRGYGSGVHKEYTFIDDPEVVAETLQTDIRLEEVEQEEDLIKSVVNAQIDDFFEGN